MSTLKRCFKQTPRSRVGTLLLRLAKLVRRRNNTISGAAHGLVLSSAGRACRGNFSGRRNRIRHLHRRNMRLGRAELKTSSCWTRTTTSIGGCVCHRGGHRDARLWRGGSVNPRHFEARTAPRHRPIQKCDHVAFSRGAHAGASCRVPKRASTAGTDLDRMQGHSSARHQALSGNRPATATTYLRTCCAVIAAAPL